MLQKKYLSALACLAFSLTLSSFLGGCSFHKQADGSADASSQAQSSASAGSSASSQAQASGSAGSSSSAQGAQSNASASPSANAENTGSASHASSEPDTTFDLVFIGDSQFNNGRDDHTSIPDLTSGLLNADSFVNLGSPGTPATTGRTSNRQLPSQMTNNNFVSVANAIAGRASSDVLKGYTAYDSFSQVVPSKVDYYIIEYGYNDYQLGRDLSDQKWTQNPATYFGALTSGISTLKDASPKAKFVVCGPGYALFFNAKGAYIGDGNIVSKGVGTLSQYAQMAQNAARDKDALFLDCYFGHEFNLDQYTTDDYLMKDGVHFTNRGRITVSHALARLINKDRGVTPQDPDGVLDIGNFH